MSDRIEQLRKLLQLDPNDAFCLYGLALEFAKLGRHEDAVAQFDRAILADPNSCYSYYHKAKSLEEQGRMDEAKQTLSEGMTRAKAVGDQHALSELSTFLFQIEDE